MIVDLLILGAGWTSSFIGPLCEERSISYALTTRSGRDSTIKFEFDPDSGDMEPYKVLPDAQTVLITFPIEKSGASCRLVKLYIQSRTKPNHEAAFVQLGSTGIWDEKRKNVFEMPQTQVTLSKWYDRLSPYLPNARADAEDEFLSLSPQIPTTVLNLAGLWGGSRSMKNWVGRVAPTKEMLEKKGSIHMIHGLDVSRAILAVHGEFWKATGQRWILTDGRVYDWWDLASAWGAPPAKKHSEPYGSSAHEFLGNSTDTSGRSVSRDEERGPQARWVRELMEEHGVRALPRNIDMLGRALDSRDFWKVFGLSPLKARLESEP